MTVIRCTIEGPVISTDAGRVKVSYHDDLKVLRVVRIADGEKLKEEPFEHFHMIDFTNRVNKYAELCNHK